MISDNARTAYGLLRAKGYNHQTSSALIGNMIQESGAGLNTSAVGDNGNAFGIAQWNGPRRRAYLAYAKQRGADPADLNSQIDFLDHEMKTSEAGAAKRITEAPDLQSATLAASKHFWRPGIPHNARRVQYAQAVGNTLSDADVRSKFFDSGLDDKRQPSPENGTGRSRFFDSGLKKSKVKASTDEDPAQATKGDEQSYLGGVLDSFTSGVTLGLGDELTALENAVIGGTEEETFWEEYDRFLAKERDQNKRFAEENPVTDTTAKIAGAVTGAVAGAPEIAAGARAFGVAPAVTTAGKVGRAAGGGAAGAAVVGFNEGEGGFVDRATDAALSAPVGAVGGVVGREVMVAAGRALGPLVKRGQAFANGVLTRQAQSALQKAGIDPKLITKEMAEAFEERARISDVTPETANRAAADEFGVPLSKGQATGDFDEIAFEEAARTGARGQGAGRIARAAQETQREAIDQAQDDLVPGGEVDEATGFVVSSLQAARARAKAGVQDAYDAIPDGTVISADAFRSVVPRVTQRLEEFSFATPSTAAKQAIKEIQEIPLRLSNKPDAIGVEFRAVERVRQKLNSISRRIERSDPQGAFEVGVIKGELDNWIEDSVANALIAGDGAALQAVKAARKKYKAFREVFTKSGPGDDVGRMLETLTDPRMNPEGVTPQEMARYMLGGAQVGAPGHSVRMARRVKDILGQKSPEMSALRRAAWLRVVEGSKPGTKPGAQKTASAILNFTKGDGAALARELFSQGEINKMVRFANVLRMTVPPKGATNPSGTAAALARTAQDSADAVTTAIGVGTGNIGAAFGMRLMQGMLRSAGGSGRAARNFNPRGWRPGPRGNVGGAVGGGVAAQEAAAEFLE